MRKLKRGRRPTPLTVDSATLTPQESRKITRFGANHTYQLLRDGRMPAIKVGARFFIPKAALMKWLETCGAESKPAA